MISSDASKVPRSMIIIEMENLVTCCPENADALFDRRFELNQF